MFQMTSQIHIRQFVQLPYVFAFVIRPGHLASTYSDAAMLITDSTNLRQHGRQFENKVRPFG